MNKYVLAGALGVLMGACASTGRQVASTAQPAALAVELFTWKHVEVAGPYRGSACLRGVFGIVGGRGQGQVAISILVSSNPLSVLARGWMSPVERLAMKQALYKALEDVAPYDGILQPTWLIDARRGVVVQRACVEVYVKTLRYRRHSVVSNTSLSAEMSRFDQPAELSP